MDNIFTVINIDKLKPSRWYIGRGRNSNVALWDGEFFITVGTSFGRFEVKYESYYTDDGGTFQPFLCIDEGVVLEPFGSDGWDRHYGKLLGIKFPVDLPSDGANKV